MENLLANTLYVCDTLLWSDIIIKYYNINFSKYTDKIKALLNSILNEIKVLDEIIKFWRIQNYYLKKNMI